MMIPLLMMSLTYCAHQCNAPTRDFPIDLSSAGCDITSKTWDHIPADYPARTEDECAQACCHKGEACQVFQWVTTLSECWVGSYGTASKDDNKCVVRGRNIKVPAEPVTNVRELYSSNEPGGSLLQDARSLVYVDGYLYVSVFGKEKNWNKTAGTLWHFADGV